MIAVQSVPVARPPETWTQTHWARPRSSGPAEQLALGAIMAFAFVRFGKK